MKMLALSWDDVQSNLLALSDKIERDGYSPDLIVGIARGGWVIARLLSDMLSVSDLATMAISFYKGIDERLEVPTITQPVSESPIGKSVLIVDDVADSGESLKLAKRHIAERGARSIRIATIHVKPQSVVIPDFYISCTDSWVLYPWEMREAISQLVRMWGRETNDAGAIRSRLISAGIPEDMVRRYAPDGQGARKPEA